MGKKKVLLAKQVRPYEKLICSLTGQILYAGDWYYEDEENHQIYLYEAYHQRREAIKKEKFDYSKLLEAQSLNDYKKILKQYEKETLAASLDDIFDKEFDI